MNNKIFLPDIFEQGVIDVLGQGHINNLFPISKNLVIICTTGGASLFDIHNQKILWEIVCPSHMSVVNSEYSLMALSDGNIIYLWDLSYRKIVHEFVESESIFHKILFSPDDKILASSSDRGIKWWDTNSYQEIHSIENQKNHILAIAFSSDNNLFACGSNYNNLSLWNVKSKTQIKTKSDAQEESGDISNIGNCITEIAFSFDNSYLITNTGYYCPNWMERYEEKIDIDFWNLDSLDSVKKLTKIKYNPRQITTSIKLNTNLNLLISGDRFGRYEYSNEQYHRILEIWDLDTDREIQNHGIFGYCAAFVPNSNFIVSANSNGTVRLWDISSKSKGELINIALANNVPIRLGLFLLLKDFLVGILFLNQYRVKKYYYSTLETFGNTLAFSPDSNLLVSGDNNGVIKLYGVVNTIETKILTGHTAPIDNLIFSPDSKLIASSSQDQTIKVWDVASGKIIHTIKALSDNLKWENYSKHNQATYNQYLKASNSIQVDISSNGKLLASANSLETEIKIWDIHSGELIKVLEAKSPISSLTFSPDNKLLAAGSVNEITLWDMTSEKYDSQQLKLSSSITTKNNRCAISSLQFSLNSSFLITEDINNVKVWNIATGKEIQQITVEQNTKISKHEAWHKENVSLNTKGIIVTIQSNDSNIHWWKLTLKQQIVTIDPNLSNTSIALNEDKDLLAVNIEGAIFLYLIEDFNLFYEFSS